MSTETDHDDSTCIIKNKSLKLNIKAKPKPKSVNDIIILQPK